jgi:hypothetical protein
MFSVRPAGFAAGRQRDCRTDNSVGLSSCHEAAGADEALAPHGLLGARTARRALERGMAEVVLPCV